MPPQSTADVTSIDIQCGSDAPTQRVIDIQCGSDAVTQRFEVSNRFDAPSLHEERPEVPPSLPRSTSFLVPERGPDEAQLLCSGLLTNRSVRSVEEPQPLCPGCAGHMDWSRRGDGPYIQGWHCDHFAACGSSAISDGAYRWHCPVCCADVCVECAVGLAPRAESPGRAAPRGPPPLGAVAPVALAAVAPCAERKLRGHDDFLPSLGVAALSALDELLAAADAPSSHVQASRPPPDLVI